MEEFSKELKYAISASIQAGQKILEIYNSNDIKIDFKKDNSPLTIADKLSNNTIKSNLTEFNYPIMSEEDDIISYNIRKNWNKYWLIDPLDGTKEFIKRNGEFTVNVALIENNKPVIGVVYAPVLKTIYFAEKTIGAFKIEKFKPYISFKIQNSINLTKLENPLTYTIVCSRSHSNEITKKFIESKKKIHKNINVISIGSSLKICKVAERSAHCYPRLGPTMEWDTAAAHAIVNISNKKIFEFENNKTLSYNKESLLNPYFVVE